LKVVTLLSPVILLPLDMIDRWERQRRRARKGRRVWRASGDLFQSEVGLA
jgi:hypothetical protein